MAYFISKIVDTDFDKTIEDVTEVLSYEGFGIISEVDVSGTLKNKLDVDFKKYRILGACNPNFAYEALQMDDKIGVILPCNVVVIEQEKGKIEIAAVDPMAMVASMPGEAMSSFAFQVKEKLKKALARLK